MDIVLERPAAAVGARIGDDLEMLETLKADVREGRMDADGMAALRLRCDRELAELRAELDALLGELKQDLNRMRTGRRLVRRAA